MHPAPRQDRRNFRARNYLRIATAVFGLSLVPAVPFALVSIMVFDAGASWETCSLVLILWAYPVLVIFGLRLAWKRYAAEDYRAAIGFSLLPLLAVAAFVVLGIVWT